MIERKHVIDHVAGIVYGIRMIWEFVHGPIPEKMQINHINGIKNDNRIENLELVTASGNLLHAYKHGLATAVGENNGRAKLTVQKVLEIRASKKNRCQLAREYGVDRKTIRDIVNRVNWSHVK